jgi:hypothetical protein
VAEINNGYVKNKKEFVYLIAITILIAFSCLQRNNAFKNSISKLKPVFGLYSYQITGNYLKCEGIKYSIELNKDSTFFSRIYCASDSNSLVENVSSQGYFQKKADSVFLFKSLDNASFYVKFLNDSTFKITSPTKDDQFNFPYKKESDS